MSYINESEVFQNFVNISNTSLRISDEVPEPPGYIIVTATVFYVIVFILGVFGNIIVIVVILASKNMKSTVNMFLINLCVADLLVMFICMPPTLVELHSKEIWYFGEFMCKLVPFLELVVSSASIFTILTISIERYRVVCHPLSVSKEKVRQFIRMVVIIWILALLTSAPILPIIVFKDSRLKDGTPIQVCRIPVRKDWHKAYFIINSIIIYFVPFVVLSALYIKLCRKLVPTKYLDDTTIELQNHTRNDKLRLRWQVINIIATIVCVFFICHLPYRVVSIWMMLENNKKLTSMGLETYLNILYSARLLLYFNHALNPILYNFVSTKFRMALRHLLYPKRRNSSSFLYDRRKSPDVIKQKTQFKQNCIPLKEQNLIRDKDCKSSSTDSRGKMNDFSPLYANVCDTDNQKVVCAKEISQKSVEKEEMNCSLSTPIIMNIRTSTSPVIRLKLETKEGYLFGITVEKFKDHKLKKEKFVIT